MTKDGLYATAHRIQSLHGNNGTLRGLKVIEPLIKRIEGYIQLVELLPRHDGDIPSQLWVIYQLWE